MWKTSWHTNSWKWEIGRPRPKMDKPQKVSIQFKKGDKVIQITMEGGVPEDGASRHWQEELDRALGMVTSMAAEDPAKPWYKKKPCPLRCDFMHPNGSFAKKHWRRKRHLWKLRGCAGCAWAGTPRGTTMSSCVHRKKRKWLSSWPGQKETRRTRKQSACGLTTRIDLAWTPLPARRTRKKRVSMWIPWEKHTSMKESKHWQNLLQNLKCCIQTLRKRIATRFLQPLSGLHPPHWGKKTNSILTFWTPLW